MPETVPAKIFIVGTSARAAAQSAAMAGFEPLAADLFADADLAGISPADWPPAKVENYPGDFAPLAARAKEQGAAAWLYTGALENHPQIVASISDILPLWGNGAVVLRRVRSPDAIFDALSTSGFSVPQIGWRRCELNPRLRWLKKPLRSAGGSRIEPVDLSTERVAERTPTQGTFARENDHYFQEYIPGPPFGAAFLAADGKALLLGIARQLVGTEWLGSHAYHYAGSIGPLCVPSIVEEQFARLGEFLAEKFQLTGLFGIDAIVSNELVWPVEINPRYTASMELIQRAGGVSLVALHATACQHGRLPASLKSFGSLPSKIFGKGIVFAKKPILVSAAQSEMLLAAARGPSAWLADIPTGGTAIEAGQPIATLFAAGDDEASVQSRLRSAAEKLYAIWK